MNSLYGKLGQRDFLKTYFLPNHCINEALPFGENMEKFCHIQILNDDCIEVTKNIKSKNSIGRLVRFSSYIAAKARSNLMNYIYRIGEKEIYYCDTDSFISKFEIKETSNELGGLKLEKKIKRAYFYAPKFYELISENEEKVYKLKGIIDSKNAFEEKIKGGNQKSIKMVNKGTFKRKFGGVTILDQEKEINLASNRRNWINDDFSKPFKNIDEYLKKK